MSVHLTNVNLINSKLIDLFCNIKKIKMKMDGSVTSKGCLPFSMLALLNIIKESNFEEIEMEMKVKKFYPERFNFDKFEWGTSWIGYLWSKHSEDILNKYKEHKFNVELRQYDKPYHKYDRIIITRIR